MSSFFGTGGGFIRTPLLISWFGFPVTVAAATSIFALSIYASFGGAIHILRGNVEWSIELSHQLGLDSWSLECAMEEKTNV